MDSLGPNQLADMDSIGPNQLADMDSLGPNQLADMDSLGPNQLADMDVHKALPCPHSTKDVGLKEWEFPWSFSN